MLSLFEEDSAHLQCSGKLQDVYVGPCLNMRLIGKPEKVYTTDYKASSSKWTCFPKRVGSASEARCPPGLLAHNLVQSSTFNGV